MARAAAAPLSGGGPGTAGSGTRHPAVAVTVADARPEPRNRVGNVRNGLGMVTASVTTGDDVAAWVKAALEAELLAQGLRVASSPEGGASLAAPVAKVECDAFFAHGASVMAASLDTHARAAMALFLAYCTPAGRRQLEALLG